MVADCTNLTLRYLDCYNEDADLRLIRIVTKQKLYSVDQKYHRFGVAVSSHHQLSFKHPA
jgi:hypothetical protein